jgi:hypothetical protein
MNSEFAQISLKSNALLMSTTLPHTSNFMYILDDAECYVFCVFFWFRTLLSRMAWSMTINTMLKKKIKWSTILYNWNHIGTWVMTNCETSILSTPPSIQTNVICYMLNYNIFMLDTVHCQRYFIYSIFQEDLYSFSGDLFHYAKWFLLLVLLVSSCSDQNQIQDLLNTNLTGPVIGYEGSINDCYSEVYLWYCSSL